MNGGPCFERVSIKFRNICRPHAGIVINNRSLFAALCAVFAVYSGYVYTRGTEAPHVPAMSEQARRGQALYQRYNCTACHQFYGLGGYMGPDLTNVISKNGETYARAFIASGTVRMPDFDLSEEQVDDLVAYLAFVDRTGTYPAETYDVEWYGTVAQEDDPR